MYILYLACVQDQVHCLMCIFVACSSLYIVVAVNYYPKIPSTVQFEPTSELRTRRKIDSDS